MGITQKLYDDFSKGINVFDRDIKIKDQETPYAVNVWGTGKNSIAKRPGFSLMATIGSVNKVTGLGTFYSTSARELLAMAGGKLYKVTSGSSSQIGSTTWTADKRTDFCQAGGKVFIQNGTENLREYNGSTIADTTNGQIGKFTIFYKGNLFVAGDPAYPTRLYRSGSDTKLGDFTYNVTTNPQATSVFIGKDDGQAITGLFKHQDYLYVLKENSIWSFTQASDSVATPTVELIDPSRGSSNHWTIDSVDNDTFFFNDYGVYAFGYEPNIMNQIRTNIVSLRIDQHIKTISKSRLTSVSGIYFDNHYYLAYTSGGGTYNDKLAVYDRQRLGWWMFDGLKANCFTEYKDANGVSRLYYGSDTDGSIYYMDETAKNDESGAITSSWKSPSFVFGDYFQEKFYLQAMLLFGRTPGKVNINVYVDGKLHKTKQVTLGDVGTAGMGIAPIGTLPIGVPGGSLTIDDTGGSLPVKISINKAGRNIQFEITDQESGKSWNLNSIEILLKPLSRVYQPNTL